ncbi:hypothetical protein HAP41_0000013715 [Bradyrhizobium barranii subsp. apii]|uniref:Uncharacterized protein n=1 Tax=Bradyrhizobium barranii subsp. apii TaxID=2819348 RepID=A0A8U0FQM0_9BRAD|nr:hypothetical protein [Bradyrhizobium barranii]UPT89916.1 hypothetical protein HAP41_0000013715 [Bradyrhizobium barranii subsp. apii]
MTLQISRRGKECLKTVQTLPRTAKAMMDQLIAAQLKSLARLQAASREGFARRCKGLLDPALALNTGGIYELMSSFPQQLSGRPEIELLTEDRPQRAPQVSDLRQRLRSETARTLRTERLAKSPQPTLDELLRINEWSVGAVRLHSGPSVSATVKAAIDRNCRRREGEGRRPHCRHPKPSFAF